MWSRPISRTSSALGIDARLRVVDSAQYRSASTISTFDVISSVIAQSQSPGNEQREMWTSAAADLPGSRNFPGIKNPAIDALVDRVVFATNRDDLVAATHALDRALLWNCHVVPQWFSDQLNVAYWNKFGMPAHGSPTISASISIPWWIDTAREKTIPVEGATP